MRREGIGGGVHGCRNIVGCDDGVLKRREWGETMKLELDLSMGLLRW